MQGPRESFDSQAPSLSVWLGHRDEMTVLPIISFRPSSVLYVSAEVENDPRFESTDAACTTNEP